VRTDEPRAFWITSPGHGEIRTEHLPAAGEGDACVRALYSGVSRGTESLVFRGLVPPGEYGRMRAPFQDGEFPGPVKYGYASVGEVYDGPPALAGRRVFVLYPHQTRYVVPASAVHVLPDNVPAERAILAANLETAINAVWDARPLPGDRVAVVGGGTVGSLVAWLIGKTAGCFVQLVDVNAEREATARALGVGFARPADAASDADLVLHASGNEEGLATALRLAAFEALVVELSWYGNRPVAVPLGESFHSRRLTLKSSQVGTVAAPQRARWDTRRRMQMALSLLSDPALDVLITGESHFDALPDVMPKLAEAFTGTLCHRIRYV
jgi:NADPH:quinone reductase-like Zn-dependent oxidoreductase